MARFRALGERLAGAVIDLGLPDRSGEELVSAIRAVRPDLPIVLTTGLADQAVCRRFAADDRLQILSKPFDPRALIDGLRKLGVWEAAPR